MNDLRQFSLCMRSMRKGDPILKLLVIHRRALSSAMERRYSILDQGYYNGTLTATMAAPARTMTMTMLARRSRNLRNDFWEIL